MRATTARSGSIRSNSARCESVRTYGPSIDSGGRSVQVSAAPHLHRSAARESSPPRWPTSDQWQARSVMTSGPRVIGMVGGMSWESSAEYYRLANELVRERLGGLHSARLVLTSVDFADIEALQVAGRWDEAGALLADTARSLEAAGADLLVLCTNTMHLVADPVQRAVGIPLLHIADVAALAVRRPAGRPSGLLGTAFTDGAELLSRPARRPRTHRARSARRGPGRSAPHHLRGAVPGGRAAGV